jgi:hypothetical protein
MREMFEAGFRQIGQGGAGRNAQAPRRSVPDLPSD